MIDFIPPNKIKHVKDVLFADEGKMLEFYEGLSSGKFKSESATKRYFYPNKEYREGYFNRLKRNLQDKLAEIIFFIDYSQSPYDSPNTGYIYCAKKLAIINTWMYFGKSLKGVLSLAEKTLRVAKHHGFAEIIFFIARYCYYYYSGISKFDKAAIFETQFDLYGEIIKLESKVDIIYINTNRILAKTAKSLTSEQEGYIRESVKFINSVRKEYSSYRLNTAGVLALVRLHLALKDTKGTIHLLEDVITDAKAFPKKYPSPHLNIFYSQAIEQFVKIGDYKRAESLSKERKFHFEQGSLNWAAFNQMFVILKIHSKDYKKAYLATQEFSKYLNLNTSSSQSSFQQHIHIINGFVHFLAKAGKVEGVAPEESNFTVKEFIKNVPNYKIDTGGFGFSVNVVEFIHGLVDKDYSKLIDKRDSLNTYVSKYLKGEGSYRARYFLKLLIAVVTKDFSRVRVEVHVKEYRIYNKLCKKPLSEAKQDLSLEIIPFEDLWQMVLELLD